MKNKSGCRSGERHLGRSEAIDAEKNDSTLRFRLNSTAARKTISHKE